MRLLILIFSVLSTLTATEIASRERTSLDAGWRFTLGDPTDAHNDRSAHAQNGPVVDHSGDSGAGAAELANKSGDAGAQASTGTIFDYPEPGVLDKTKSKDRTDRAVSDAQRSDPRALNLGGAVSYVQPGFDDHAWSMQNLPHDWVVALPFGGGDGAAANIAHGRKAVDSRQGTNIGWYRRVISLPAGDQGRRISIEFDGIYRNSLIWLNGHCLGRFTSGYTSFTCDITKYAHTGADNTLVVRVDATRGEGWFYEGGGIYRHVWLVKTPPVHVDHWGTSVTATVHDGDAQLTVATTVQNDGANVADGRIITVLVDAMGTTVAASTEASLHVGSGASTTVEQQFAVIKPHLWSVETPYLYRVVTRVTAGTSSDCYETPYGIRTIVFDVDKGFFLNGKAVKIKGTCNHQDHAGLGSALPDRVQEFRIAKLKEMGSNAYRCAHGPPTPELLDACDRQGMLVMDENRRFDTSPEVIGQLSSLIRRDRNHPSVIIWCLANEEMDLQRNEKEGVEIAQTMQDCAHRLDPTRPTTIANNAAWKGWRQGFNKIIQMAGSNYFSHEAKDLDRYHAERPDQLIIGSEEASTLSTRGEYLRDARKGFTTAYGSEVPKWGATPETWWKFYVERPWLAGGFAWTGFDYRGEPTPFNQNYSSQFGILDTCGFAKDIFYYYQAWWSDQPVLHLLPHWDWAGREGQIIDVWAFSNHDEVHSVIGFRDHAACGGA